MPGQHWIEEHPEYGHVAGCGFCDPVRPQLDMHGTGFDHADAVLTRRLIESHHSMAEFPQVQGPGDLRVAGERGGGIVSDPLSTSTAADRGE